MSSCRLDADSQSQLHSIYLDTRTQFSKVFSRIYLLIFLESRNSLTAFSFMDMNFRLPSLSRPDHSSYDRDTLGVMMSTRLIEICQWPNIKGSSQAARQVHKQKQVNNQSTNTQHFILYLNDSRTSHNFQQQLYILVSKEKCSTQT